MPSAQTLHESPQGLVAAVAPLSAAEAIARVSFRRLALKRPHFTEIFVEVHFLNWAVANYSSLALKVGSFHNP